MFPLSPGSEASHDSDQSDGEQHPAQQQSSTNINPTIESTDNLKTKSDSYSSEGDNSVFGESTTKATDPAPSVKKQQENSEEVDDIELIFSSDDKDYGQDDLVSIGGDYEPWEKAGSSGTPILMNFATVGSDQETDVNFNRDVQMEGEQLLRSTSDMVDQENRGPSNDSVEIHRDDSYDTFDPVVKDF